MTRVAVVAHAGKSIGGGLDELRSVLEAEGVSDPLWYEVPKSKKARKRARTALREGADLVFVWGGDGTVQRCVDELAGSGTTMAIIPAGTANLLATELGIPPDITEAVRIGLEGRSRTIDVGNVNGEHFAVMAGAGFDARMVRDAEGQLKDRLGKLAYVWSGAKHLRSKRVVARVDVDGETWFRGPVSMVLIGNVGTILGGISVFDSAEVDSGRLEVGVVTAQGPWQWLRALARAVVGRATESRFVQTTAGRAVRVRLARALPYELDGDDRKPTKDLDVTVEAGAINIRVPERQPT